MLLAELEVWHTRPAVPTRRLSLGHLILPVDPAPGFGGLLLGAVVAGHIHGVDDELHPDVHRLIDQIERGDRVVQPRLRHRFQVDRHGLARSRHRLIGNADDLSFDLDSSGTDLAQVLGAVYAVERLEQASRLRRGAGPAQGGAVAGPDRAGADRPPRRCPDDHAVGARRSHRVGARCARLPGRHDGADEAGGDGPVPPPDAARPSRPRRRSDQRRRARSSTSTRPAGS